MDAKGEKVCRGMVTYITALSVTDSVDRRYFSRSYRYQYHMHHAIELPLLVTSVGPHLKPLSRIPASTHTSTHSATTSTVHPTFQFPQFSFLLS